MRGVLPVVVLAAFFVLGSFLFSGCSRKGPQPGKKQITLKWTGYADPIYKLRIEQARNFEKIHPGVKVKYTPVAGQAYVPKVLSEIAGGMAPDIFMVTDMVSFISKGALLDLTPYINKDRKYFAKIYPALIAGNTWKGKIYGLPANCAVDLLFYNKDAFDAQGLSYPDGSWTWEDMLRAAKKLTKRGPSGRIEQYGLVDSQGLLLHIFQAGGRLWNKEKTRSVLNSPEAQKTLTFWRDVSRKYRVAPLPLSKQQTLAQSPVEAFVAGRAAMLLGYTWNIRMFKYARLRKKFAWDATYSPKPDKAKQRFVSLWYLSLGAYVDTKHPQLAYELLRFLTEPDQITLIMGKAGEGLPLRRVGKGMEFFRQDKQIPEDAKVIMRKSLKYAQSYHKLIMIQDVPTAEWTDILTQSFDRFLLSDIAAAKALSEVENKLNTLLKEKRK
jgi:multiple sugar transport system substrate-binding protein